MALLRYSTKPVEVSNPYDSLADRQSVKSTSRTLLVDTFLCPREYGTDQLDGSTSRSEQHLMLVKKSPSHWVPPSRDSQCNLQTLALRIPIHRSIYGI